jgi:hypothetical protein
MALSTDISAGEKNSSDSLQTCLGKQPLPSLLGNHPWFNRFSQELKSNNLQNSTTNMPQGLHGQDTLKCPQHSK